MPQTENLCNLAVTERGVKEPDLLRFTGQSVPELPQLAQEPAGEHDQHDHHEGGLEDHQGQEHHLPEAGEAGAAKQDGKRQGPAARKSRTKTCQRLAPSRSLGEG